MFKVLENVTVEELNQFVYPLGPNTPPLWRIVRTGPISKNEVKNSDKEVWRINFLLLQRNDVSGASHQATS